jgi:hypothetical protein
MKKILAYTSTFLLLMFLMAEGETLKHTVIQGVIIISTLTYLVYYNNARTV